MSDLKRLKDFNELVNQIDCDEFYHKDLQSKRKAIARRLIEITNSELTKKQREVLLGIYFEKLSIAQLSERMGICPSAIYRIHKRAIERMKKYTRYMSLRA